MKILNWYAMIFLVVTLPGVLGQSAQFQVTSLTCTDATVGSTFSCTATILNAGDAASSVGSITLFPDSNDWLEKSSYVVPGEIIDNGETVEITFTGLKVVKSGNANGFTQVAIDDVTDTSSAVTELKVNAVDVAVTVLPSPSSTAQGGTFTAGAEVTAGGNVDATLTFTVDSGGCSIGNQDSQKNISGMKHGSKQSRTWTVTQGSGDCKFTITAVATGSGTKTDSTTSTVSCTNCASGGTTTTSGGGGGGGALKVSVGELAGPVTYDLGRGEKLNFISEGENHSVTVTSFTETTADIVVQSNPKRIQMIVGDEKKIDLNDDGQDDISLKLNSINVITKKLKLTLSPLRVAVPSAPAQAPQPSQPSAPGAQPSEGAIGGTGTGLVTEEAGENVRGWLLAFAALVAVVGFVVFFVLRRRRH